MKHNRHQPPAAIEFRELHQRLVAAAQESASPVYPADLREWAPQLTRSLVAMTKQRFNGLFAWKK
jgi:hypothetical protein